MQRRARGVSASFLSLGLALAISGPAAADKIKHSIAVFSGLDKITGRIISFEVSANETVQFGSLLVTDRVCYTRPPTEAPQTDTFVQVDEVDANKNTNRIFSGWMFAASPGLNALDHPIYDIWLTDCKGTAQVIASPPTTAATPEPEAAPAPQQTPQNSDAEPAPAPVPAKPPRHVRHSAQQTPQDMQNGPVDVSPPPGFQAPPDNGGDNQDRLGPGTPRPSPDNGGDDDQAPPPQVPGMLPPDNNNNN
ncbi:MAG: DUF2155 domain-containing protein [Methylovirgula sp.]|uniref:DUF2155 domain-containing protein n=1 Tax=Methylovirgula sp. TaxID=1978224 RepID=UPI0030768609